MTMADTVAVMNAGRIEQLGPPQQLYDLPRTAFVANFLGRSNLIAGTVVDRGDVLGVDAAGTRLQVPAARSAVRDGEVLVGIRPEKMRLLRDGEAPGAGATVLGPGTVADVSFSGVSTEYLVDVAGVGRLSVFAQNLDADVPVMLADEVRLTWSPQHAFALAAEPSRHDATAAPEPATVGAGGQAP